MNIKQSFLLSLFSLVHVSRSDDVTLYWGLRETGLPYDPITVYAGDTITFEYPGSNIDVYLHPSGTCNNADAELVGSRGAGSSKYTFKDSQTGTNVTFACHYWNFCEMFGMIIDVLVVEPPPSSAPLDSPTDPTAPPSLPPTQKPSEQPPLTQKPSEQPPPTQKPSEQPSAPNPSSPRDGLSTEMIYGIVAGAAVVFIPCLVLYFFFFRKRGNRIEETTVQGIKGADEKMANANGYFTSTSPAANSSSAKTNDATALEQPSAESVSGDEIPLATAVALPPPVTDVVAASDVNQQTNEDLEMHIVSKL